MDNLTDRDRQELAQVEDALQTYPLADTPARLASRVMLRVRAAAPSPRFRVGWLDYVTSLAASGTAVVLLIAWSSLPPHALPYLQTRAVLVWQFLQRARVDWILPAAGLAVLALFAAMTARLLRPAARRLRLVRSSPAGSQLKS